MGRTYEEDDDEDVAPDKEVQLTLNSLVVGELVVDTQIVAVDRYSAVLVASMVESYRLELSATIVDCLSGELYSKLYYNNDSRMLLVTLERDVPVHVNHAWLQIAMSRAPQFVLALGSLSVARFSGQHDGEGTLRKLQAHGASEYWAKFGSTLDHIRFLEIGNIVTGSAAAVLAHCAARRIPSLLLVTVTSAAMTMAAAQCYERAWPVFAQLSSLPLRRPTAKEYSAAVRSDPFLLLSENLYC